MRTTPLRTIMLPLVAATLAGLSWSTAFCLEPSFQDGVAFAKTHSVAVGPTESDPEGTEAAAIHALIAGSRVFALGEPPHGAHEPLVYRNRLIAYLIEHEGFTAVALESGLADTRSLNLFVLGGEGEAEPLVHRNLSWGFNQYPANVALIEWLRSWNSHHPDRTVRLYGIDLSGGDEQNGFSRAHRGLDELINYLASAGSASLATAMETFGKLRDRFTPTGYALMPADDRARLDRALESTSKWVKHHRLSPNAASSQDASDWALRAIYDCRQLIATFRVWPADPSRLSDNIVKVSNIRDRAMADNTLWVLHREGPHGRVLLFQANGHVSTYRFTNHELQGFPPLISTGEHLRAILGPTYAVMQMTAETGIPGSSVPVGSIERAMSAAGRAPLLLNLRSVSSDGWWARSQTMWQPGAALITVPRQAMDALLFLPALTREVPLPQTH